MYFVSFPTAMTSNFPPRLSHIRPVTVRVLGLKRACRRNKGEDVLLPEAEEEPTIYFLTIALHSSS